MLDIKYIRENAERVKEFSEQKGCKVDVGELLAADGERRELAQKLDDLRAERNRVANEVKKTKGKPAPELIKRGKQLKDEITVLEAEQAKIDGIFTKLLKQVPNAPYPDVPVGFSEDDNVVAEVVGEPTAFDFPPKNHYELAAARGWLDKERAAKVAGARFAYIKGEMVKLQMALVQWVIDTLTSEQKLQGIIKRFNLKNVSDKPFVPVLPPLMIKTEMYDAMDRLEPRDDRYKIEDEELWLQGSAEHVLGSMYAGEILEEKELPVRMLGYATSFRQEAGTYGKDMEGIIRMHQFDKLEMEGFSAAESSFDEHLLFVAVQRYLLEELRLPYRVLQKCTYDIGKPNARGIDMEVWLPAQGKYRETHTADYMTDYQSRRLKTRVKRSDGEIELLHTNDATAFALGRIMVAIIENYQTKEGEVVVPEVLRPYIGGATKI
ncbi:MAG: serine--tRNA ligase [Candidatus Nomurabacteria bacterium]|jgi:seryl-tRNA synthetase|nr:serine--tRNA ligase [Candidatus Nomurabacteria bacterium]